jgi:hypothetical protein
LPLLQPKKSTRIVCEKRREKIRNPEMYLLHGNEKRRLRIILVDNISFLSCIAKEKSWKYENKFDKVFFLYIMRELDEERASNSL